MPVVSVHGPVSGIVLSDPPGLAAEVRGRLRKVPLAFRERAANDAARARNSYPDDFAVAAVRGDGLLFHTMAAEYLRALFIAWFAANGACWPHEKRLGIRLRLMRRGDLAALEEDVWAAQDLNARLIAIDHLSELRLSVCVCVPVGTGKRGGHWPRTLIGEESPGSSGSTFLLVWTVGPTSETARGFVTERQARRALAQA
jgi:hypothetical protein